VLWESFCWVTAQTYSATALCVHATARFLWWHAQGELGRTQLMLASNCQCHHTLLCPAANCTPTATENFGCILKLTLNCTG
jgi:hypothetical protein